MRAKSPRPRVNPQQDEPNICEKKTQLAWRNGPYLPPRALEQAEPRIDSFPGHFRLAIFIDCQTDEKPVPHGRRDSLY